MKKFKISTVAAIVVYAMLAVVFLMWVFGLYYLWTSELSYIMCFMFTTFGAAGWVYFAHIIDDKVRY
jgi:hypothetical protein